MIFLDSNVIIAYKNKDDINHKKAYAIFSKIVDGKYGQAVISEFIFSEVVTVLFLRKGLKTAAEVGKILKYAHEVTMIRASEIFDKAWEIFIEQKGTKFSFVDASTIACLRDRAIKHIATFDLDFEKIENIDVVRM
ncbi:MAG: PIN domain-containing protein [Candidatus Thermoplasmatota archaeon]